MTIYSLSIVFGAIRKSTPMGGSLGSVYIINVLRVTTHLVGCQKIAILQGHKVIKSSISSLINAYDKSVALKFDGVN